MIEILFYVCMIILSSALANFIQVINLSIMFFFFHMENWVGIYICSWKRLKQVNVQSIKKVTQHMYYAYHLHDHPGIEPNAPLYRGGPLYQQYIVDAWASIEQSNLNWFQNNQKTIRADLYKGVVDAATNTNGLQDSGQRIVLPSSHTGSPPCNVSAVSGLYGNL